MLSPRAASSVKSTLGPLSVLVAILGVTGATHAEPVTYAISGTMREVTQTGSLPPPIPDEILESVYVGAPFSATLTINRDPASVTSSGNPNDGSGYHCWCPAEDDFGMSLSLGGSLYRQTNSNAWGELFVNDGDPAQPGEYDRLSVGPYPWTESFIMFMRLYDSDATALNGIGIPTSFDLADWDDASSGDRSPTFHFAWNYYDIEGISVKGTIESMVLVPEPTTGLLVLTGMAVLGRRRHRRIATALRG